jgi:AAA domain
MLHRLQPSMRSLMMYQPSWLEGHTITAQKNEHFRFCFCVLQEIQAQMASAFERRLAELARKPRILVCAPSNAAADELLQRVMDDGFADGGGHVYRPSVVRIGAPPARRVESAAAAGAGASTEARSGWWSLRLGLAFD